MQKPKIGWINVYQRGLGRLVFDTIEEAIQVGTYEAGYGAEYGPGEYVTTVPVTTAHLEELANGFQHLLDNPGASALEAAIKKI